MSEAKPPKKMTAALQSTWRVRKAWDEDGWEIYPDYKTKLGDPCEVARTTDAHKAPRWVAELIADAGNTYNTTGLTPSQLVEQRDGLAGLLSEIYEMVRQGALPNGGDEWFELTSAALAKARPNTAEGEATASDTDGTRWNQTPCEHCGHTEGEHFNARCLHITGETRYTPAAAKEPSP